MPLEERRFKEMKESQFGDESEQAKICKDIMARKSKLFRVTSLALKPGIASDFST